MLGRPHLSWKSVAAALGLAGLMTFANLASGADRIDNRRPSGRIRVIGAKLAPTLELAAGDRAERVLELKTGGRSRVKLLVTAPNASPLVDPNLGVRLRIDRCSKTWKQQGAVYSCPGRAIAVLTDGPAVGRHPLRKLAGKRKNHLRLTLTLPQSAPNALQGQNAQLVYKFSR